MRASRRLAWGGALLTSLSIVLVMAPGRAATDNAPNRIRIDYVPPTNPEHQPLYDTIKRQHSDKIVRTATHRVGMRLKHALALARPLEPAE